MSQLHYLSSAQVKAIHALHEELGDSWEHASIATSLRQQAPDPDNRQACAAVSEHIKARPIPLALRWIQLNLSKTEVVAIVDHLQVGGAESVTQSWPVGTAPDLAVARLSQALRLSRWKTVLHNVAAGLPCGPATRQQAHWVLNELGLATLAQCWPALLSHEQRWRVALARVWLQQPAILLCDAKLSALDHQTRQSLWELLKRVCLARGIRLVLLNQDEQDAGHLADRILYLQHQQLVTETQSDLSPALPNRSFVAGGNRTALKFRGAI